jgi:hypothetical protein
LILYGFARLNLQSSISSSGLNKVTVLLLIAVNEEIGAGFVGAFEDER